MNRLLSFRYCFESPVECDFIFLCFVVKVAFKFKSQGTEKIEIFSQGTKERQNLRYESLIIIDPKNEEISSLAVLNIK